MTYIVNINNDTIISRSHIYYDNVEAVQGPSLSMKDLCKIEKQGDSLQPENDDLGIIPCVDRSAKGVGGGNVNQTWLALEAPVVVRPPDCHRFVVPVGIVATGSQRIFHHFTIRQGKGEVPAAKGAHEITAVGVQHMDFK